MSDEDDSEKTEEPSPDRRKKARDEGQFARSKDAGAVAATVSVLLVMNGTWRDFAGSLREFCLMCFHDPQLLVRGDMTVILEQSLKVLLVACMPIGLTWAFHTCGTGSRITTGGSFQPMWRRRAWTSWRVVSR